MHSRLLNFTSSTPGRTEDGAAGVTFRASRPTVIRRPRLTGKPNPFQRQLPWFQTHKPPGEPRFHGRRSEYRYVRRVKHRWQARVWVGNRNGGAVNLGLYSSEWEAARVVREWLKLASGRLDPLSVWLEATRPLIAKGLIPPHVLPQGVEKVGGGFVAVCAGKRILGPFTEPEEACRARIEAAGRASA